MDAADLATYISSGSIIGGSLRLPDPSSRKMPLFWTACDVIFRHSGFLVHKPFLFCRCFIFSFPILLRLPTLALAINEKGKVQSTPHSRVSSILRGTVRNELERLVSFVSGLEMGENFFSLDDSRESNIRLQRVNDGCLVIFRLA